MSLCEWCGAETTKTIFIEIRKASIQTNTVGSFKRNIRASRTVPCCAACYDRIVRSDPKRNIRNKEKDKNQLNVFDVLKMVEEEGT